MLIIGELINCTRKKIAEAVEKKDWDYLKDIIKKQADAGAHYIDLNSGIAGREAEVLKLLVELAQEVTDLPVSLDCARAQAIEEALPLCKKTPFINSITAEKSKLQSLLPLAASGKTKVIALCMGDEGIPSTAEDKFKVASRLIDEMTRAGLPLDNIYVDACVFPISTDQKCGMAVLDAIERVMGAFKGVHTSIGLSNVSYGLPERKLLNQTFMLLAMAGGLDAVILDPLDSRMMANITAAEVLLGRDDYCIKYIEAFKSGKLAAAAKA
jgi:5-methyltetrahydrofolate--homocysteine methyltransferase